MSSTTTPAPPGSPPGLLAGGLPCSRWPAARSARTTSRAPAARAPSTLSGDGAEAKILGTTRHLRRRPGRQGVPERRRARASPAARARASAPVRCSSTCSSVDRRLGGADRLAGLTGSASSPTSTTTRAGFSSRYTRNGAGPVVPTKATVVPSYVASKTTSVTTCVPGGGERVRTARTPRRRCRTGSPRRSASPGGPRRPRRPPALRCPASRPRRRSARPSRACPSPPTSNTTRSKPSCRPIRMSLTVTIASERGVCGVGLGVRRGTAARRCRAVARRPPPVAGSVTVGAASSPLLWGRRRLDVPRCRRPAHPRASDRQGGGEQDSGAVTERCATAASPESLAARPPGRGTPRRHVLFLPPPANYEPPSSSGPGRRPFKAVARVRTPLGARTTAPQHHTARPCSAVG